MLRRLPGLLLIITVALTGLAPVDAHVTSGIEGHACCRTLQAATVPHSGCAETGPAMRCCAPPSNRGSSPQVPPGSASPSHQPDVTPLKGHAGHASATPVLIARSVAGAFESARLKLPHDPLYLRHLVFLV